MTTVKELLSELSLAADRGEVTPAEIVQLVELSLRVESKKSQMLREQLMDTETALVAATYPKQNFGNMTAKEFMHSKLAKWAGKTYFTWTNGDGSKQQEATDVQE